MRLDVRPIVPGVEDWGKLFGDMAAVASMPDRLLRHDHVLKCGPKRWRTKTAPAN